MQKPVILLLILSAVALSACENQAASSQEHPHNSIPNGVEFSVDPGSGACGHVGMD